MNNRHRRVTRLLHKQGNAAELFDRLSAEGAKYFNITADEAKEQIRMLLVNKSINLETWRELNR